MKRRQLLRSLFTALVGIAAPRAAFAQSPAKVWRIGVINPGTQLKPSSPRLYTDFFAALRELGYVEGGNLAVQWQFADNDPQRLPALAAELAKAKVDLFVTNGTPPTQAIRQYTTTIPILVLAFSDPVENGLAKSLARPGGNVTGQAIFGVEIGIRRFELLAEVVPGAKRIAWIMNPDNPGNTVARAPYEATARRLGRELMIVPVRSASELNAAFDLIVRARAGALQVSQDATLQAAFLQIAELALQRRLPSIFPNTGAVIAEYRLIGYTSDFTRTGRAAAMQADKIFKGANPADIPIELPTHFNLAVNLKVAKALGITIPPAVMVQATRVIE